MASSSRARRFKVGIDVGGSSIKCALVDLSSGAFASERFSTPTPAQGSDLAYGLLDPRVLCGEQLRGVRVHGAADHELKPEKQIDNSIIGKLSAADIGG